MPVMDPNRCKDSGEMYSPDDQGEYTSLAETLQFSLQGLSNALADVGEETGKISMEEYALLLEVTMADRPGRPCPPAFSWNVGMIMHIFKSDPVLWELGHVQVDGPGTAYLFFYDKQGCWGLEKGGCRCCPNPCRGGLFGVDLMLCPLQSQPSPFEGGVAVVRRCIQSPKAQKLG